jgi:thioredoxin 1
MASDNVLTATDDKFDSDILNSEGVHLVDFWAEWCGPCRMLGPTVEEIAGEMVDKVKVHKLNVDDNPQTPSKYHVRGIPTLIIFKDGKDVEQLVGNQPKEVIVQALQKHV